MLTVEPYLPEDQDAGNVYKVGFQYGDYVTLSIERTDVEVYKKTEYILGIKWHGDSTSMRVTDEEMQEIVLAYLAVKQEIEESTNGR